MGENIENYSLILITTTTMMTIIEIMSWQPHHLRASRSHPTGEGTVPLLSSAARHMTILLIPDFPPTDQKRIHNARRNRENGWYLIHTHTHTHS